MQNAFQWRAKQRSFRKNLVTAEFPQVFSAQRDKLMDLNASLKNTRYLTYSNFTLQMFNQLVIMLSIAKYYCKIMEYILHIIV